MEQTDLLQRIQNGDQEAFRALFHAYAEPIYYTLFKKCGSKATARMLLKRVFQDVRSSLKRQEEVDPTALWLNALANWQADTHLFCRTETEAVWQDMQTARQAEAPQDTEHIQAEPAQPELRREPFTPPTAKNRRVSVAGLIILLTLGVCLIWVTVGLLMEIQVLPRVDLGYEWFNTAVFHLF